MNMRRKILLIVVLLLTYLFSKSQIVINEYQCSNLTSFADNFGNYEDWIELYNTTASTINLSGYYLSDKVSTPKKWQFGAGVSIPANGFLRIWASGNNINTGANLHTNFSLTQTKPEVIILTSPALTTVDVKTLVPTQAGHSYGRKTDGNSTWAVFSAPTPNASNNTATAYQYCPRPVMSFTPGFYPSAINVGITVPTGYTVYYTTNGSTPTSASSLYAAPINISTTTVLRARAFSSNPNNLPSFVESNTYFINVSHTVAVVSIFGDQVNSLMGGNSGIKPETGLEYFNTSKIFKTEAYGTANKHGNDSWSYPQRGIDFVDYDDYGYNYAVKNKLFPTKSRKEFQKIILKAAANDNYPFECPAAGNPYAWGDPALLDAAHIRDAYCHTLSQKAHLHLDERTWSPCVLYVNGQYWGVYEIREKVDDSDFMDYYYNISKDSLQMLKTWGSTWAEYGGAQAITDWNNLKNFILSNNMTIAANYNYVDSLYDVKSLADYVILNSMAVTSDWLNWNTIWWRGLNAQSQKKKWRYALWDNDATFRHYVNYTGIPNSNANADPCDPQTLADPGGQGHVPILNALLQNPNFKQYYVMRYFDLLNSGLSCTRMVTILDSMINTISPEMNGQITRWGGTYAAWYNNYQALRNFILQRCDSVVNGFSSCYNTTGPFKIKVNVSPINAGTVNFNSLHLTSFVWTGNYPGNLNIILKAQANAGYCFDHWALVHHTPTPNTTSDSININLTTTDSIVAIFVPANATPSITASAPYICKGEDIQLQVAGSGSILWTPSAGLSCSNCSSPIASPTINTTYSVSISGGCLNGSSSFNVKVYSRPSLVVPTTPTICTPSTVQINAVGGVNYTWTPSYALSCNNCASPIANPNITTQYTVTTSTDPMNRCADTKTMSIIVDGECPELYVPTGFSPNGDNNNDIYYIYGYVNNIHFVIYDRWGQQVFETNDIKKGWDGKYNGEYVQSGVYAYILTGTSIIGESINKSGNITVVR